VDADAGLGAGQDGVGGIEPDEILDLLHHALRFGRGEVDLVDHRDQFQVVVDGEVGIGESLSFHALAGVDDQQGAFAGLQAAGNFVGEIDVAGRINQVQLIEMAVIGVILQADGVGLDGDAALALQVHGVQHLRHHLALRQGPRVLQKTVCESRLSMVDVRNDREVPNVGGVHAVK
jgi:hypothetical protein